MQIKKRIEEIVYPEEGKEHPEAYELTEVDQQMRGLAIPILLFFKEGGGKVNVSKELKGSLRKVLAIFYPLAGRLVEREGGGGHVDISCLDQGSLFCEAWADCPLSSLAHALLHPDPLSLSPLCPLPLSFAPLALLHVQVTHFTCGGFCLCVQENHILNDGSSFYHFMESWVEILNGSSNLTLDPHFNSSLLRDGYKLERSSLPAIQYYQNLKETASIEIVVEKRPTFISKVFPFSSDFIRSLKEDAKLSYPPSSFECIVAYLWKNVTRARQVALSEEAWLYYPMNVRKRFDPPLPQGYFGNAICISFAYTMVEDLLTKPLSYTMNLIREATSSISSDDMKSTLNWSEKQHSQPSLPIVSEKNLLANSWSNFLLYDMNFPWGKPHVMRALFDPCIFGEHIMISPSSFGKGHLEVLICLKSEHMDAFETLIL